jgi:energy-coupling factor transporter ATP-binding protein EcfA2
MTDTLPTIADTPPALDHSPEVPWDDFLPWFYGQWQQGEHVTLIGTTGSGKSTLAKQILHLRRYIVAFCVKNRDTTMEEIIREFRMWRQERFHPDVSDRIALWPKIQGANHRRDQKEVFGEAMDTIYRQGGWCCFFDEVSYLSDTLNMDAELKFLLQQGRSSSISIVGLTQRPAFIPLAFYDQASHLFVWKDNDHRNIRRIAELTGDALPVVQREIPTLGKREVLYIQKDTGLRVRTTVEV